jgi:hypothetical protein
MVAVDGLLNEVTVAPAPSVKFMTFSAGPAQEPGVRPITERRDGERLAGYAFHAESMYASIGSSLKFF